MPLNIMKEERERDKKTSITDIVSKKLRDRDDTSYLKRNKNKNLLTIN